MSKRMTAGNASIPDALMHIVSASDQMGAIAYVFHNDRVVHANRQGRLVYPSLDWSGSVWFDDCFRAALSDRRILDADVLGDPEGHLVAAKVMRARSRAFRFRRRYGTIDYDRHHIGLDASWNAQIWFPVRHESVGDFALTPDTKPWELRRYAERERALSRVAQALDGLGVALAVLRADGALLDATRSMEQVLAARAGLEIDDKGRIAAPPTTTARLRRAIARVAAREAPGTVVPLRLAGVAEPVHAGVLPAGPHDPTVLLTLECGGAGNAEAALADAYGLTAQEAAVAARVAAGLTAEEVALDMGRALPTVRTQLSAARQKIAADRQHRLAHVLTRAAAMVGGLAPKAQGTVNHGRTQRVHRTVRPRLPHRPPGETWDAD
ncbi:transcriptional regulator [Azospirillum brasilense]|uniref:Transcriptional regulator n=1 Tax=Azospirillum brasilense TaxID=192 RepID=A0A4D8QF63_AZOBR|nr:MULTISPECIES: LuxR C-terminal-related transcriptional regulator [Azospirillum]MDW7556995.1 LuxR C-terminal-related transcriptional regulator [Azospirillum brasilense]MDW7591652.1 LuxR C-terminal-related transcriptional regulator [Azospirillum brasilense]MDW7632343.1 LuxR C-terminal-related transcriptional regulator [Azospirillum brasilense]MDX5952460.1 LuxR C-terminal-related transcriptional regulator [Azospirillum brasilense]OPH18315.1 hypothetical protein FE88_26200 [Azospirillum brasilen